MLFQLQQETDHEEGISSAAVLYMLSGFCYILLSLRTVLAKKFQGCEQRIDEKNQQRLSEKDNGNGAQM
jgi:hypothetical protein